MLHDMKGLFGHKYCSYKYVYIWRKANLIQMKHVLLEMLYYTCSYGMGMKLQQSIACLIFSYNFGDNIVLINGAEKSTGSHCILNLITEFLFLSWSQHCFSIIEGAETQSLWSNTIYLNLTKGDEWKILMLEKCFWTVVWCSPSRGNWDRKHYWRGFEVWQFMTNSLSCGFSCKEVSKNILVRWHIFGDLYNRANPVYVLFQMGVMDG